MIFKNYPILAMSQTMKIIIATPFNRSDSALIGSNCYVG